MGKSVTDAVIDAQLVAAEGDRVCVCSQEATTYLEAITTFMLAIVTVGGGDFTKANGDVSGRKNTLAAKNAVAIVNNGTATHVVIANLANTTLRRNTTCASQVVTAGGTLDIASSKHEILDPS